MNLMRLLANAVLYLIVVLVMDLFKSNGSMSLDGNELLGRGVAGIVFAALFEVVSPFTSRWSGKGRK